MGLWEYDPIAKMGLRCKIHPKCFFCGSKFDLFSTKLIDFPLNSGSSRGHAIDVVFMCPQCGYLDVFGVAIDKGHFDEKQSMIHGMLENMEAVYKDYDRNFAKEKNVTEGVNFSRTPLWDRVDGAEAHEPKFRVGCFHCGDELTLRHSTLAYKDEGSEFGVNQACYKCSGCGWFIRFNVVDETEYLKEIREKCREKKSLVPDNKKWSDEDEEIGRQLEALGYWGGR